MEEGTIHVRRWFEEVWNRGNTAAIDEMLADGAPAHGMVGPDGQEPRGPEGFKPLFLQLKGAFPDIHIEVEDTVSEGDKVAARCTVRGTHTGEGVFGPPTNRPVEIMGMVIAVVRGGKIVESWNCFDFAGLHKQLGLVP